MSHFYKWCKVKLLVFFLYSSALYWILQSDFFQISVDFITYFSFGIASCAIFKSFTSLSVYFSILYYLTIVVFTISFTLQRYFISYHFISYHLILLSVSPVALCQVAPWNWGIPTGAGPSRQAPPLTWIPSVTPPLGVWSGGVIGPAGALPERTLPRWGSNIVTTHHENLDSFWYIYIFFEPKLDLPHRLLLLSVVIGIVLYRSLMQQ